MECRLDWIVKWCICNYLESHYIFLLRKTRKFVPLKIDHRIQNDYEFCKSLLTVRDKYEKGEITEASMPAANES